MIEILYELQRKKRELQLEMTVVKVDIHEFVKTFLSV